MEYLLARPSLVPSLFLGVDVMGEMNDSFKTDKDCCVPRWRSDGAPHEPSTSDKTEREPRSTDPAFSPAAGVRTRASRPVYRTVLGNHQHLSSRTDLFGIIFLVRKHWHSSDTVYVEISMDSTTSSVL